MSDDKQFYRNILDHLQEGVFFIDKRRRINYWNRAAERITGFRESDVRGRCCADNILAHVDDVDENFCARSCPLTAALASGTPTEKLLYLRHRDGHRVPVTVRVTPVRNAAGRITGAVETFTDGALASSLAEQVDWLQKMALLDPLTQVGNRRYVEQAIGSRLGELQRYGWTFGVLFIDIDGFKEVNDQWGHAAGDAALRMIARTLANNVRSSDTVGRWGGDEFLAVVAHVDEAMLRAVAEKLRVLVRNSRLPSAAEGVSVTVSIGASMAQSADTLESLMRRADTLMYQRKGGGRNHVCVETAEPAAPEPVAAASNGRARKAPARRVRRRSGR
jgi:diguanylate cyclase (GGDEF)-like protein/PAS domain S-box-containing protein